MTPPDEQGIRLSTSEWVKGLFVGAGALFLGLGALILIGVFARILAIVVLAISIAAALSPLVDRLSQRLPRTLAIILVYIVLLLLLAGIIVIILPTLVTQGQSLVDRIPEVFDRIEQWVGQQGWVSSDSLMDAAVTQLQNFGSEIIAVPVTLVSMLLDMSLVIILSLYMLIETEAIRQFGLSLFPRPQRQQVWEVGTEMLEATGGFIRGLTFNILIVGMVTYLGLNIIGVNFALALGILAGLFEIIPVLGPIIAAVPAIAIAALQSPVTALITAVFLLVVQQFEGNILTPNVMHHQAKVSPLLVLIAVFAGSAVGGVVGALVSIPLVAALRVLVIRVIAPAIRSLPPHTVAPDQPSEIQRH